MRTAASRRPLAAVLVLVGASFLFTGCGDPGAHLPAGSSGANYAGGSGNDVIDSVFGTDPGPQMTGVQTSVDDPVLAGYDGIDTIDGLSGDGLTSGLGVDDPYNQAIADWNEHEGSIDAFDNGVDDFDDDFEPVGYGGGYDDGWGYGGDYGIASTGGWGGAGMMDAGFDPGVEDPGFTDAGFEDPGFADPGFDAAPVDVGMDPGVVDAGVDSAAFMDPGAGAVDVGGMDAGIVF
jgi:hypothetical protein